MGRIKDIIRAVVQLNDKAITDQDASIEATGFTPVLNIGHLDPSGVFHPGGTAMYAPNISDAARDYALNVDHPRRLQTYNVPFWVFHPAGRWILLDDGTSPLAWAQATGTVARSTTAGDVMPGQVAGITTTAAAGVSATSIARMYFLNNADVPKNQALIYLQAYVKFFDTNVDSAVLQWEFDNNVTTGRRVGSIRFLRTGANTYSHQVTDSTGSFQNLNTGIGLRDGGSATDPSAWHLMGLLVLVSQSPVFARWFAVRFDDRIYRQSDISTATSGNLELQATATNANEESNIDLKVINASGVATTKLAWGGIAFGDLLNYSTW